MADDTDVLDDLAEKAKAARAKAYVPYSDFDAAAAVLGEDGETYIGVLVENVSLGLAMCGERNAMFAAVAAGTKPTHLVLDAPDTDGNTTMPCGACLQVALELGGPEMVVASHGDGGDLEVAPVGELLPRGPKTDTSD